ncbi:MAG: DedA family protein [Solirubrobacteraceae bacterium]
MGAHEIQHLLGQYGLGVVFSVVALQGLGAPLPGTTVLIAAAVYASTNHGLPIVGVVAAGTLGAVVGTSAGFALGRWRGADLLLWLARRLRQSPALVTQLRAEFTAHGGAWLVVGRFISGLRNVTGLLAGLSGMSYHRFVAFSAAAAGVWAAVNALEYYWFGRALAGADTWLQIVLICAGAGWLLLSLKLLRRRARERLRATATQPE